MGEKKKRGHLGWSCDHSWLIFSVAAHEILYMSCDEP